MGSVSESEIAIDRISNLPNNLISHILSFLSTEDAVRTSILSTHWNQHWSNKTNLDFDDGLLIEEDSKLVWNPTPRSETSFVNFVYRVLLFKVTRLDLFKIKGANRDYGVLNVSQWLSIALSRNVREIDLLVPLAGRYLRNDQLLTSRTLVTLSLGFGFHLKVPQIISLTSLKFLQLNQVQFEDGESLSRLVSSCLVLEHLRIVGILCEAVYVLNISSPVLKSLILFNLYSLRFSEIDGAHSYKVVLDTPSLQYFEHNDKGVPDGYHIVSTLHCLDEARISLFMEDSYEMDDYADELILVRSMADLAVAISNVRSLYFSEFAFEAFYRPDFALPNFQLPNFTRLTNLDIDAITNDAGLSLLIIFLQSAPQFASLSFALEHDLELWDPPTNMPSCMLDSLKSIKLVYYRDPEIGLSIVKYFLEKTDCLEEMIIPLLKEKGEEFIKEVSLLPTASKSCKIVVY